MSPAEPLPEPESPETASPTTAPAPAETSPQADTAPGQEILLEALRTVRDPEVGINVVDLGLIYGIQSEGGIVDVDMTLTTPACPAGPQIIRDAITALERVDGVVKANVRIVLNPPWSPARMSDEARDELGIF